MLNLCIQTDNAAFEWPYKHEEVARILQTVVDDLRAGNNPPFLLFDINGNFVGECVEVEEAE